MTLKNGYVWFLPFWLSDSWWDTDHWKENHIHKSATDDIPCTSDQMRDFVAIGYFTLCNAYYAEEDNKIPSGLTVNQWKTEYEDRAKGEVRR